MKKIKHKGLIKEINGHLYYNDYCVDKLPILKFMTDYKITDKTWTICIDENKLKKWIKENKKGK